MIEKLMLHLQYEAELAGIKLPLDAAVKRLHPGSKEGAAIQQLAKLRTILLTEGHMVPPKAKAKNKRGPEYNPQLRGYIRPDGAGPYETRVVGWGEKIVDLSKNIENPGIYRGSGKYPRHKKGASLSTSQSTSMNEDDQADDDSGDESPIVNKSKLMVTLRLNPKHLAMFSAGHGNRYEASDSQQAKVNKEDGKAIHDVAREVGVTKHDDFKDDGDESDDGSVDGAEQKPLLKAIKRERFDSQDAYGDAGGFVDGAGYSTSNTSQNWLGDGEIMMNGVNDSYGGGRMMSYESAVSSLAGPAPFNTFNGFNLPGSFGGSGLGCSSTGCHQYNIYNGSSMVNSGLYDSHAAMSMSLATNGENGGNMGMPAQYFPSYPYCQVSVNMKTKVHNAFGSPLEQAPKTGGNGSVIGDSVQQPPVEPSTSRVPETKSSSNYCASEIGPRGETEDYDVGDFLSDDIFETSN